MTERLGTRGGKGRKEGDIRGEYALVVVKPKRRSAGREHYDHTGQKVRNADRVKIMLDERRKGRSWEEASRTAGFRSTQTGFKHAQAAIAAIPAEAAEEIRRIEAQRLDEVVRANWNAMLLGDPDASNIIIRASERRAKLFGIDQPPLPEDAQVIDKAMFAFIARMGSMTIEEKERELHELRLLDRAGRVDHGVGPGGPGTGDADGPVGQPKPN